MVKVRIGYVLAILLGALTEAALAGAVGQCPAVSCDCASLPAPDWQRECQQVEVELKTACQGNNQQPIGFCGIHGPNGKPLPLATQLNAIERVNDSAAVDTLVKQLATAQWSLREDLVMLKKHMDAGHWSNLTQIAKMLDNHVDAAFILQRRIAGSWQGLNELNRAEKTAEQYVKETRQLAVENQKLGNGLWQMAKAAEDSRDIKTRQFLAQRLLRISGKLFEQQAFALTEVKDDQGAAKAWQDAARLAELQVQLETLGTQKVEYLTFYRQQAAARWNRASLYWALAKNTNNAAEAYNQSRHVGGQLSVAGEGNTGAVPAK